MRITSGISSPTSMPMASTIAYSSTRKLATDPSNAQVSDADLRSAVQATLSPALTVVLVGNSAEIAAALKDRYQVEALVLP